MPPAPWQPQLPPVGWQAELCQREWIVPTTCSPSICLSMAHWRGTITLPHLPRCWVIREKQWPFMKYKNCSCSLPSWCKLDQHSVRPQVEWYPLNREVLSKSAFAPACVTVWICRVDKRWLSVFAWTQTIQFRQTVSVGVATSNQMFNWNQLKTAAGSRTLIFSSNSQQEGE